MKQNSEFFKILFKNKTMSIFIIIIVFIYSVCDIFVTHYVSHTMDIIKYGTLENYISLSIKIIFEVLLVCLLICIFEYIKEYYLIKLENSFRNNVRKKILKKINSYNYKDFKENDTGKFISWLSTDVDQISNYAYQSFINMSQWGLLYIISIIAIFYINIVSGIVTIILSLTTLFMPFLFNKMLEGVSKESAESNDIFVGEIKDLVLGYDIFTLNNLKELFTTRVMDNSFKYEEIYFKYRKQVLLVNTLRKLSILFPIIITFGVAAISVVKYNLPIHHFLGIQLISNVAFNGISIFFSDKATLDSTIPIFEKYTIEVDEEELDKEKEDISEIDSNKIKVSNISFSYKEGKEILKNFSTEFTYPNKYFIVGKSGGGKTTLLKLIQGLYEVNSGEISIGDKNIKNLSKKSLREIFGYLSQDIYLFTGTIRENITLWQEYSDEEIWKVLKMCKIEEYVKSLEKGLDTVILENGKNISGGQRQRIGLSRLLLRNPKYLLIDEGTSQLDEENRLGIEETLLNLEDKGVLIITHNLQENYDKRCSIVEV